MYTYIQRPVCKKENTATYVHTGGVSNAYSCIRTARARVHGWVGMEKMRRCCVHGEATECVVFIGRQQNTSCSSGANRLGQNSRNEAWRTVERRKQPCVRPAMFETGSCSSGWVWRTAKRRKRACVGPPIRGFIFGSPIYVFFLKKTQRCVLFFYIRIGTPGPTYVSLLTILYIFKLFYMLTV